MARAERGRIQDARRELRRLADAPPSDDPAEHLRRVGERKDLQREIFLLKAAGGVGALPDFAVVGAKKGGTTSLYRLLCRHPLVEPAAVKEPRFFDLLHDRGVGWYRSCFPEPRKEGRRETITGEASPYLSSPAAPGRMARVVPDARLVVLLRNPVDRALSDYHQVRKGWREERGFREAAEEELARIAASDDEDRTIAELAGDPDPRLGYLSRGAYAAQLERWWGAFGRDRVLVLVSEDLFERPGEVLGPVLAFLDLPPWEPEAAESANTGAYTEAVDSALRHRLEAFYRPRNERLYGLVGRDVGW